MLFYIYICIVVLLLIYAVRELFTEKNWKLQVAYALLIIPLVLRTLLIK
jgi:hypothetical protein